MKAGQTAPNFSLYDSDKNKVTLAELKGAPVLLLFFPMAFTSTCTEELCAIRDNISVYNKVSAKVFGISVDSVYTLARFKEDQQLNFSLLSDFNKETSTAYKAIYEKFNFDMKGVSKRAAFLIDSEGSIRYAEVLEDAGKQPDFDAINGELRRITE
ncbi:MAG: redoxin domain-containing protein [Chitinophagaceae bacterium]